MHWIIHVDRREKIRFDTGKHVNYVTKSHFEGQATEHEFLYFLLTLHREIRGGRTPAGSNPHVIELEVAIDGLEEPDDLPSAPWY